MFGTRQESMVASSTGQASNIRFITHKVRGPGYLHRRVVSRIFPVEKTFMVETANKKVVRLPGASGEGSKLTPRKVNTSHPPLTLCAP